MEPRSREIRRGIFRYNRETGETEYWGVWGENLVRDTEEEGEGREMSAEGPEERPWKPQNSYHINQNIYHIELRTWGDMPEKGYNVEAHGMEYDEQTEMLKFFRVAEESGSGMARRLAFMVALSEVKAVWVNRTGPGLGKSAAG